MRKGKHPSKPVDELSRSPIFSSASRAIVDPLPFSSSKKPRRPCA
jgi:hypothetical protein